MPIINIYQKGIKQPYWFSPGQNLLDLLRENGYSPAAPCGGHGICGKCRVVLEGDGRKETVCACKTAVTEDCTVYLPDDSADITWNITTAKHRVSVGRTGFGAAVDLGTTTVAVSLFDLSTGERLGDMSQLNAQKAYGADVISKISVCIDREDGLELLSGLIRRQILAMLKELCGSKNIAFHEIKEIFLAGNTVMQHIFAAIPPDSIATAPFTPLSLFDTDESFPLDDITLRFSPCVAGYVGGDITAGLLSSGMNDRHGKALFIDIGTNGEMALGDTDGFTACAVASGPAFEGMEIDCGMPAQPGAIHKAELTEDGLRFEVIGGGEARGICGSGLLDIAACLLELGYIDESGRLEVGESGDAAFYLTDQVYISQRDIRQLQLAKAAVAAGIKLLMRREKIDFDGVSALYLAGGFGNRLRPESAAKIGMLPSELLSRVIPCGNTSLSGAEAALLDPAVREKLYEIKAKCRYMELSSDPEFSNAFIEEMCFDI